MYPVIWPYHEKCESNDKKKKEHPSETKLSFPAKHKNTKHLFVIIYLHLHILIKLVQKLAIIFGFVKFE